jgi:hypothetical protein
VDAVLVQGIKIDVEGAELLFVIVVIARDAMQRFQARIGGRHTFAHHLDDGVAARNLDVFFALTGGTGAAHVAVYIKTGSDNRGIADTARNLPRQS